MEKLPGYSHFTQCTIDKVQYGEEFDHLTFDILDGEGTRVNEIRVCNRNTQKELQQLFANPTVRLFWAYGMVDIDISQKSPGIYLIEWSPCDGVLHEYEVSETELRKLLNTPTSC